MMYLASLLVFMGLFALLGIGFLLAKKTLRKCCSADPADPSGTSCACHSTPEISCQDQPQKTDDLPQKP